MVRLSLNLYMKAPKLKLESIAEIGKPIMKARPKGKQGLCRKPRTSVKTMRGRR
jgi:hypothetical protein